MPQDEWKTERSRAEAEAATRRKTPFLYAGVDLQAEARKYCRALGIAMPTMKVRHGATHGSSGRAWYLSRRIVLTIGPNVPAANVMELLLHELAHIATPGHHHDETYCTTLVRTARQLWSLKVDGWLSLSRGGRSKRAYAIDDLIRKELSEKLSVEPVPTVTPPLPPPVSLAERREQLVLKREARARKALDKAEVELRRVQKRLSRWKAKVRYYERRAAAKGKASKG